MAEEEPTAEEVAEPGVDLEAEAPPRALPDEETLATIVEPHQSASWVVADDEWVVSVDAADYHSLVEAAMESGFDTFIDLCAVDYFRRQPRFEVVLTLLDYTTPMRLRVRAGVDGAEPQLSTVSDLFAGANFYEREAYDLLGIDFVGHPDLTRILLPDEWEGHPLRKDYAVGSVPIQFKESHKAQ
ncbi:MAG: NADH-quinone oxidoreductase subunit C [bacterium]|nr:NADH-quinone oxidoreductase subunit C [bacterium]